MRLILLWFSSLPVLFFFFLLNSFLTFFFLFLHVYSYYFTILFAYFKSHILLLPYLNPSCLYPSSNFFFNFIIFPFYGLFLFYTLTISLPFSFPKPFFLPLVISHCFPLYYNTLSLSPPLSIFTHWLLIWVGVYWISSILFLDVYYFCISNIKFYCIPLPPILSSSCPFFGLNFIFSLS